jgi:amino acid adenylation domain-containing protein
MSRDGAGHAGTGVLPAGRDGAGAAGDPLPDGVAATASERGQWMLHRLLPDRGICNLGLALRVEGPLRWWPLREALNHLLYRHPALRAVFRAEAGGALRKWFLPPDEEVPLTTHAAGEDTLTALLCGLLAEPFDVDRGLLLRAHLVSLPDGASVVCVVTHHLVTDHQTLKILQGELPALYDGFAASGEPPESLARPGPRHQERPPQPGDVEYWVRHLDGFDPAGVALSGARPVVGRPTFAGGVVGHPLSAAALAAVGRVQERSGATQNMVLLAAFYLMLLCHGARRDLVVGVPVTGRRAGTADAAGFHVSTLPIRVRVDLDGDVAGLLEAVGVALLSGLEHAGASYEAVQPSLTSARSGDWRVPTFRHAFNYRARPRDSGSPAGRPTMAGLPVRTVTVPERFSRLDLEWVVLPGAPENGVTIRAIYSTEVHDRAFVELLVARYEAILSEMAEGTGRPVRELTAWTPADREAVRRLNDTPAETGRQTVLEQVRARARQRPDAPALRYAGGTVSYGELVAAADGVRRALRDRGLGPGDVVALLADRGPGLAAAALGVWAAGAAYLPLDPAHPVPRLADQLDDARAGLLLADQPPPGRLAERDWLPLAEACGTAGGAAGPVGDWSPGGAGDCAYLIYTSGSTGRPKGVQVSHGNLGNVVGDFARRLGVTAADRVLWSTTFSFDISALELFVPLCTGATVTVAADADRMEADRLLRLIVDHDVGVIQATPTTWRHVVPALAGQLAGRRVLSGGEPLNASLAGRLLEGGCRLFNVYGPTETTIWSIAVELTAPVPDPVPLGHPIANTALHVMDGYGRPVPPGVRGELYIGGAGVALSYRGQPALTAERFVEAAGLGRLYRTGDEVVLTGRGLVFLGRLDRQVKVRGHRVEPAEVEAVLESHPGVVAAAVLTEPDPAGHRRLVAAVQPAAVQPADGRRIDAEALRDHVAGRLPGGAVPSRYVLLPALPHTGNGKIDYRTLADLVRDADADADAVAALPEDPVLRRLVGLWREVLDDPRLGPDTDFFASGGHSLLAVALADRIAAAFAVSVGFEAVFDAPSPRRLRALLASRSSST